MDDGISSSPHEVEQAKGGPKDCVSNFSLMHRVSTEIICILSTISRLLNYLDEDDSLEVLLSAERGDDGSWSALDFWIALKPVVHGNCLKMEGSGKEMTSTSDRHILGLTRPTFKSDYF